MSLIRSRRCHRFGIAARTGAGLFAVQACKPHVGTSLYILHWLLAALQIDFNWFCSFLTLIPLSNAELDSGFWELITFTFNSIWFNQTCPALWTIGFILFQRRWFLCGLNLKTSSWYFDALHWYRMRTEHWSDSNFLWSPYVTYILIEVCWPLPIVCKSSTYTTIKIAILYV